MELPEFSVLHAQAKPPVYLVTEIDVTNPEAYGKEFAPKAQASIKASGGKFVVIGGAGVIALSIATNLSRTTTTNENGEYAIPGLPPGVYQAASGDPGVSGRSSAPASS